MTRRVTNNEYANLVRNKAVDLISQENFKNIPKNRVVLLDDVPFDVWSLKQYLKTNEVHPLTRNSISRNNVAAINKIANASGWKNNAWNANNTNTRLTEREKRNVRRTFVRLQHQLIDRRLAAYRNAGIAGTTPSINRARDIARVLLTDTSDKYEYSLPSKGVIVRLKRNERRESCVDAIEIVWTHPRKRSRNAAAFPAVYLTFPRKYSNSSNSFQNVACIDRNILFKETQNIRWTFHNPQGLNFVPGNRVSYEELSHKLVRALGFKVDKKPFENFLSSSNSNTNRSSSESNSNVNNNVYMFNLGNTVPPNARNSPLQVVQYILNILRDRSQNSNVQGIYISIVDVYGSRSDEIELNNIGYIGRMSNTEMNEALQNLRHVTWNTEHPIVRVSGDIVINPHLPRMFTRDYEYRFDIYYNHRDHSIQYDVV